MDVPQPLHILLVDDNPDDRQLVKHMLVHAWPDVDITENADEQGLEQSLRRQDLDLVITDYQLRWTTGLDVLRRFKALSPDLPVIMFTATGSEEIAVEAMREGLDDYLIKAPKHLVRLRVAVQQVLERRNQARAFNELERRYQMLFNNAPIGLYRSKPNGELMDVNPALARMLGYHDPADLLAQPLSDLFINSAEYTRWQAALAQTQSVESFEAQLRSADGTVNDVTMNVQIISTSSGAVFYEGSLENVTARKLIEHERAEVLQLEREARQRAEEANAAKSRFLAMISHELRTPLTPIKGLASSLLATDVQFDPARQRQFIQVINDEADKLTELVEQLLDVVRLQAGTFRIAPKPATLPNIVKKAWPQLHSLTTQHQLIIDVPDHLPPVWADATRTAQVLANLVDNAAKFSPKETSITIAAQSAGSEYIQVDIVDEGSGISPEAREGMFEVFQQGVNALSTTRGLGLGLAICKGIIEAHNGRIWIQNQNAGTKISFVLPIAKTETL